MNSITRDAILNSTILNNENKGWLFNEKKKQLCEIATFHSMDIEECKNVIVNAIMSESFHLAAAGKTVDYIYDLCKQKCDMSLADQLVYTTDKVACVWAGSHNGESPSIV